MAKKSASAVPGPNATPAGLDLQSRHFNSGFSSADFQLQSDPQ